MTIALYTQNGLRRTITLWISAFLQIFTLAGVLFVGGVSQPAWAHTAGPIEDEADCAPPPSHNYAWVGNPSCQAYVAIYVDENGNLLYAEDVRRKKIWLEEGRIIKILEEEEPSHCGVCKHVCPLPSKCYCSCK